MRLRPRSLALAALILAYAGGSASGQTPAPSVLVSAPRTTWTLRNTSRVEMWRFFEPPPGGGNNDYVYAANRLLAGVRRTTRRYDATAAVQYVHFGGLPDGAVGPGPLGAGAVYFAHAGRSDSHQVYLRYLSLRAPDLPGGISVQAGRMPYASGAEAASNNPKIEAVKRQRVDARLVGEFEWSLYQRSFDGIRVEVARPSWSATAVALQPTQGGFEDAAGLMMKDVHVLGASATLKPGSALPGVDWQFFTFRYLDDRRVTARPDNTSRPAARADIRIDSFGTTLVGASTPRGGKQWDGLLWAVAQRGSWYEQRHRGFSIVAEGGHQWAEAPWRPWLRAGVLRASGDDDAADDRHGTFFQMLPTVRRYSQTASYAQMNNTDLFGQVLLRPVAPLGVRIDVHRIGLASARDLWYFGSGATQAHGATFGLSTRPSFGGTRLGTVVEGSADYAISRRWSVNGYVGVMRGGDVVRPAFAGRTMTFGYLENVLQF